MLKGVRNPCDGDPVYEGMKASLSSLDNASYSMILSEGYLLCGDDLAVEEFRGGIQGGLKGSNALTQRRMLTALPLVSAQLCSHPVNLDQVVQMDDFLSRKLKILGSQRMGLSQAEIKAERLVLSLWWTASILQEMNGRGRDAFASNDQAVDFVGALDELRSRWSKSPEVFERMYTSSSHSNDSRDWYLSNWVVYLSASAKSNPSKWGGVEKVGEQLLYRAMKSAVSDVSFQAEELAGRFPGEVGRSVDRLVKDFSKGSPFRDYIVSGGALSYEVATGGAMPRNLKEAALKSCYDVWRKDMEIRGLDPKLDSPKKPIRLSSSRDRATASPSFDLNFAPMGDKGRHDLVLKVVDERLYDLERGVARLTAEYRSGRMESCSKVAVAMRSEGLLPAVPPEGKDAEFWTTFVKLNPDSRLLSDVSKAAWSLSVRSSLEDLVPAERLADATGDVLKAMSDSEGYLGERAFAAAMNLAVEGKYGLSPDKAYALSFRVGLGAKIGGFGDVSEERSSEIVSMYGKGVELWAEAMSSGRSDLAVSSLSQLKRIGKARVESFDEIAGKRFLFGDSEGGLPGKSSLGGNAAEPEFWLKSIDCEAVLDVWKGCSSLKEFSTMSSVFVSEELCNHAASCYQTCKGLGIKPTSDEYAFAEPFSALERGFRFVVREAAESLDKESRELFEGVSVPEFFRRLGGVAKDADSLALEGCRDEHADLCETLLKEESTRLGVKLNSYDWEEGPPDCDLRVAQPFLKWLDGQGEASKGFISTVFKAEGDYSKSLADLVRIDFDKEDSLYVSRHALGLALEGGAFDRGSAQERKARIFLGRVSDYFDGGVGSWTLKKELKDGFDSVASTLESKSSQELSSSVQGAFGKRVCGAIFSDALARMRRDQRLPDVSEKEVRPRRNVAMSLHLFNRLSDLVDLSREKAPEASVVQVDEKTKEFQVGAL